MKDKKRNIYNTHDKRNVIYQHRPTLYSHFIIPFWAIISILLAYISFDKMYVIVYQLIKHKEAKTERRTLALPFLSHKAWSSLLRTNHSQPKVALIYCTYNDFLPDCLYQCLKSQTYPVDVKILDDSSKPEYKQKVD